MYYYVRDILIFLYLLDRDKKKAAIFYYSLKEKTKSGIARKVNLSPARVRDHLCWIDEIIKQNLGTRSPVFQYYAKQVEKLRILSKESADEFWESEFVKGIISKP